jgi:hypothetical protein
MLLHKDLWVHNPEVVPNRTTNQQQKTSLEQREDSYYNSSIGCLVIFVIWYFHHMVPQWVTSTFKPHNAFLIYTKSQNDTNNSSPHQIHLFKLHE